MPTCRLMKERQGAMEPTDTGYRLSSGAKDLPPAVDGVHCAKCRRHVPYREGYDGMLLGATGDEYDDFNDLIWIQANAGGVDRRRAPRTGWTSPLRSGPRSRPH